MLCIKNLNISQICTYTYRLYTRIDCAELFCVHENLLAMFTSGVQTTFLVSLYTSVLWKIFDHGYVLLSLLHYCHCCFETDRLWTNCRMFWALQENGARVAPGPLGPWEPAMWSDHSGLTAVLGSLLSPCDPAIRLMKHSIHRLSGSVIGIDTWALKVDAGRLLQGRRHDWGGELAAGRDPNAFSSRTSEKI